MLRQETKVFNHASRIWSQRESFFWIKNDRMPLRLFYADHECYKLKQDRCNDKFWCIDFYFDEIFEIKMNQHECFCKRFNELSKRLSRDLLKDEWFILSFLLTFFKQFRQSTNDFNIESYKTFKKICKF